MAPFLFALFSSTIFACPKEIYSFTTLEYLQANDGSRPNLKGMIMPNSNFSVVWNIEERITKH